MSLNRFLIIFSFLLVISIPLMARDKPDWVIAYEEGRIGDIGNNHQYVGVGHSDDSRNDADLTAKTDFAATVETRVESRYEEVYSNLDGVEQDEIEMTTEITTDISLKGITITERYKDNDSGRFYSLIRINRDEYIEIIEENIEEELALQRAELERRQEQGDIDQAMLEQDREDLQREREREQLKQERREDRLARFEPFLDIPAPYRLITAHAAGVPQKMNMAHGNVSISPFALSRASYSFTLFKMASISTTADFSNLDGEFGWHYHEVDAKVRILNNAGDVIQTTIAVGVKGWGYNMEDLLNKDVKAEYMGTPYGAVTVSVPHALYSKFTIYGGLDRIALGWTWYPIFDLWKDHLALVGEASYYFDENLRGEHYQGGILLQAGLRFKAADFIQATISFEQHQLFCFSLDVSL